MNNWTLFLDRDGVLNKKIDNGYVTSPSELIVLPGVLKAIKQLSSIFSLIFIVTNQRGIARGLYSINDLNDIHRKLLLTITQAQGRIDKIYFCPHDKGQCKCRKPNIGMGLQAKKDFPKISFEQSFMVGDSPSDIEFGSALKMKTVLLTKINSKNLSDYKFESLEQFATFIKSIIEKN